MEQEDRKEERLEMHVKEGKKRSEQMGNGELMLTSKNKVKE